SRAQQKAMVVEGSHDSQLSTSSRGLISSSYHSLPCSSLALPSPGSSRFPQWSLSRALTEKTAPLPSLFSCLKTECRRQDRSCRGTPRVGRPRRFVLCMQG